MTRLLIILLALTVTSCALTKQERRMNRATKKLEKLTTKFPELKRTDTLRTIATYTTPLIRLDTVVSLRTDTVIAERDNLSVKIVRLPGDSIYIDAKCDTVTVVQEVKIPCDTIQPVKYKPSEKGGDWWMWLCVGVVIGLVGGVIIRK